jgi:hypothetical protein
MGLNPSGGARVVRAGLVDGGSGSLLGGWLVEMWFGGILVVQLAATLLVVFLRHGGVVGSGRAMVLQRRYGGVAGCPKPPLSSSDVSVVPWWHYRRWLMRTLPAASWWCRWWQSCGGSQQRHGGGWWCEPSIFSSVKMRVKLISSWDDVDGISGVMFLKVTLGIYDAGFASFVGRWCRQASLAWCFDMVASVRAFSSIFLSFFSFFSLL